MNEYIFIFRHTPVENFTLTPEQEATSVSLWQNWIGEIASQVKFVSTNRIGFEGAIIRANSEIEHNYFQDSLTKELVSGVMIVKSDSHKEALELSKGCPILAIGGSVEVRNLISMN